MGLWSRIKARFGFGDYEYYDDDEYEDDDSSRDVEEFPVQDAYASRYGERSGGVRRIDRPMPESDSSRDWARDSRHLKAVPSGAEVSRMSPQLKMHIVEPKSFTEAQSIADRFKKGTPVIMNMTNTSPELAKRFIDFASGLTYGLDGGLQKVSDKVFMLTPANVDVSDGDVRRLRDNGVFGGTDG